MVKYQAIALDRAFGALADPTRRAIVERLVRGAASTGELAEPFSLSLPAVMKHLLVLERAGLVRGEKQGRVRRYRLDPGPMQQAASWLHVYSTFWEAQLDALDHYLEESEL